MKKSFKSGKKESQNSNNNHKRNYKDAQKRRCQFNTYERTKTESYPEKSLTKAEEIHSGRQND